MKIGNYESEQIFKLEKNERNYNYKGIQVNNGGSWLPSLSSFRSRVDSPQLVVQRDYIFPYHTMMIFESLLRLVFSRD